MDTFSKYIMAFLYFIGFVLIWFSTLDAKVISNCEEKGVYYYGQVKMICAIER